VGVAQPTARLEVAGADGLQEYPPKAMTGYETYIEGHGVFRTNPTILLSSGVYALPTWKVFDRSTDYLNNDIWHSERNSAESVSTGFYMGTSNTYTGTNSLNGLYGDYIILENPYKINVTKMYLKPRINNSGAINVIRAFTLMANNDGSTWDILTQKSDLTSWTANGYTFDVQNTNHYRYYALVVTQAIGSYATLSELRLFGTPAPSSLEDGHLTLGKALTAPRLSGHGAGAETPRAESLVVHYDTTVDSVVSGTTVVDISGNGLNGTLNGGAVYSSTERAFQGFPSSSSNYIRGNLPSTFSGAQAQTHSYWINGVDGTPRSPFTVGYNQSGGTGEYLSMWLYTSGWRINVDGFVHSYDETIYKNRWYHVTVTYDGGSYLSSYKLYIDGVYKVPTSSNTPIALNLPTSPQLRIGRNEGTQWYNGKIAKPKLYDVALTAEEVAQEYALGRTGKSLNVTDTAVCLGGTVPRAQLDVRGSALFGGGVGIGTASPGAKLEVVSDSLDASSTTSLTSQIVVKCDSASGYGGTGGGITFAQRWYANDSSLIATGGIFGARLGGTNGSYGGGLLFKTTAAGGSTMTDRMVIARDGNVGIGTTSPGTGVLLTLRQTTKALRFIQPSQTNYWDIYCKSSSDPNLLVDYNGSNIGYFDRTTSISAIDFTGQHRSFVDGVPYSKYKDLEGLIVSANKNKYFDIDKNVTTGSNAIQISQSLPLVSLSTIEKDKACFGVVSGSEDPEKREYSQGSLVTVVEKQLGDTRVYINSLGEGAMWVTNINGPLESGDYITTSNVAGYGMKQDDDILHNYTVAKITMDCDFEPLDIPVQRILREKANVTYWYQLEVVDLATWSNLTTEQRSSEEETYYTIDEHVQVYGYVDEQSNVFIPPAHDLELYNKIQEHVVSDEVYSALPDEEKGNYSNTASNTYTYTQVISMTPEVWSTLEEGEQNTYVHGYYTIVTREVDDPTATEHTRTIYQKVVNETKTETEGYLSEVREEWVNVLDEHGQLQWEDVPTGETEPAYRIRYLDADGNITTRHNEVYRAAFVGCTYHCG